MKHYKFVFVIAMLVCVVCAAPPLFAQRKGMEKLRHRIEDLRKVKLIDLLNLQGDQVEKFFGAYNRLQKNVIASKEAMDVASNDLHEATLSTTSEADLKAKTETVLARMQDFERAINARHGEVRPILSPLQYAKYIAFEARFQEELQRMILQRAKKRGGPIDE